MEVPDVVTAIDVLGQLLNRKKLLLDRSIFETVKKLRVVEESGGMGIKEFFEKFEKGLSGDDQDAMIWSAEYEALGFLENERTVIERMQVIDYFSEIQSLLRSLIFVENVDVEYEVKSRGIGIVHGMLELIDDTTSIYRTGKYKERYDDSSEI
ncbi:MAG: hypothetical protein C5S49_06450 [Candidatus Methanogaster sp.]|nr:MAG: hypothetical protein C5S49_06450 [ANME-2 cluster archaeon]